MTNTEWDLELRLRFVAAREATKAAERWVDMGAQGTTIDPVQQVMRDVDLEDAAAAWAELVAWMRRPRSVASG